MIREANKGRYLKNIVIDEAHIVVDWGAAFRVDYQCLEAWRNMLLMTNPSLRTILLSATFEDKCVEILKNFLRYPEDGLKSDVMHLGTNRDTVLLDCETTVKNKNA